MSHIVSENLNKWHVYIIMDVREANFSKKLYFQEEKDDGE